MSNGTDEDIPSFSLERIFRSDSFRQLCELLSRVPELQKVIGERLIKIFAVIDANRVNAELRWRLKRRQNPNARTSLHEALDSGVVTLVAPIHLRNEIEDDLGEIAQQCGATVEQAREEWDEFSSKLLFYRPVSPNSSKQIDPDDLPYKLTSEELQLPVYTSDRHLVRMGAPVLWACFDIDSAFKAHARSGSITVGCTLGSAFSVTVGIAIVNSALKVISSVYSGFRRFPGWLQFAIGAAAAVLILHPKSRAKIAEGWKDLSAALHEIKEPLLDVLFTIAEELMDATERAAGSKKIITDAMPTSSSRIPAIVHARRICVLSNGPLCTSEISQRMRAAGYVSRAKDFDGYLRKKIRSTGQFVEVKPDHWQLSSAASECK